MCTVDYAQHLRRFSRKYGLKCFSILKVWEIGIIIDQFDIMCSPMSCLSVYGTIDKITLKILLSELKEALSSGTLSSKCLGVMYFDLGFSISCFTVLIMPFVDVHGLGAAVRVLDASSHLTSGGSHRRAAYVALGG